jgi:acetylornithine deacetylase
MKGFLAASTVALHQLDIASLQRELVLIWTHDEEVGCLGSKILADEWAKSADPLPRHGWIGEPTDMKICRMHPGHSSIEIVCTGKAAHSSRPSLGVNAILLAQKAIAELEKLATHWSDDRRFEQLLPSPFTVMNVGQISGGNAINIIPETCVIQVGIRPLPGVSAEEKIKELEEALRPVQQHARFLGGHIAIRTIQIGPALLTPNGTPLEKHLCSHAAEPTPTAAPFATDGGNFQAMGVSSLVFGPGSIDVAHRPDEFILERDLRQFVSTVQSVITDMCIAEHQPA